MDVYDDNKLVRGGLEEEMLHITEEDIDLTASMVVVAETIVVNLQFPSNTLPIKSRSGENIVESGWLAIWMMLVLPSQMTFKLHTSNNT